MSEDAVGALSLVVAACVALLVLWLGAMGVLDAMIAKRRRAEADRRIEDAVRRMNAYKAACEAAGNVVGKDVES